MNNDNMPSDKQIMAAMTGYGNFFGEFLEQADDKTIETIIEQVKQRKPFVLAGALTIAVAVAMTTEDDKPTYQLVNSIPAPEKGN